MKRMINTPNSFNTPTKLPRNGVEAIDWQNKNIDWWEKHPMRYDWNTDLGVEEFSRDFYFEIDKRFFSNAYYFFRIKKFLLPPLSLSKSLRISLYWKSALKMAVMLSY